MGQYLLQWEAQCTRNWVADIFGYHAVQLGLPELDALEANRMPHRWLATENVPVRSGGAWPRLALQSDFTALPLQSNSIDLLVLPHTLEYSADPHGTLREVERVLVPEGRVLILGLNPTGWWALRQTWAHQLQRLCQARLVLPQEGEFIGYRRLQDWLQLLSFEVERVEMGCFRPAVRTQAWLDRWAWMDRAGARFWPVLGSAYCVVAVKRVRGIHLLGPAWKRARRSAPKVIAVAPSAQQHKHHVSE